MHARHMDAARQVVHQHLAGLPVDLAVLVAQHLRVELEQQPTAVDIARGCKPEWRGYFYGHPLRGPDEEPETWRVELDGDGAEVAAPVAAPPGGVIRIFVGNLRDFAELVEVLMHELAHFFGDDEDDVAEAGLGTFDEVRSWR